MAELSRLAFDRVVKTYGSRRVVGDLSLEVRAGTIVALAGANGSGKSTLFRIAAGFVQPQSGAITIVDETQCLQLTTLVPAQRVAAGLSYVGQERRILRGLSTLDNLRLTASSKQIFAALEELHLTDLLGEHPRSMDAGSRVRLLLAAAYLRNPRFLIADEPFAGLDQARIQHCAAILRRMRERGTGVLVTDHHPGALLALADYVNIIQTGRIVYSGTAAAANASEEATSLYFRKRA